MSPEESAHRFGPDYPAHINHGGKKVSLKRESRFWRSYDLGENLGRLDISRFMDGSAQITANELIQDWGTWSATDRSNFCNASIWLNEQADFPEMLRFVMREGSVEDWSGIAQSVATVLPGDEAFNLLVKALAASKIGKGSNFAQAIRLTKHAQAAPTLRKHLELVWKHPSIWDDDDFINWPAFEATTCIEDLLELGEDDVDFENQVRQLSTHVCKDNRQACKNFLSKFFPWLEGLAP